MPHLSVAFLPYMPRWVGCPFCQVAFREHVASLVGPEPGRAALFRRLETGRLSGVGYHGPIGRAGAAGRVFLPIYNFSRMALDGFRS